MAGFVQIGVTALKEPGTGKYMPAVPLYVKESDVAKFEMPGLLDDFARLLAHRYKAYEDGCAEAGIAGV